MKEKLNPDKLIQRIAECLAMWDGETIAKVANEVLIEKVTYDGTTDTFEVSKPG